MRKPVKSLSVNQYKTVEGIPSVLIRGTRASTNRFPDDRPYALRMCDRSQRLRDVPCAVIIVVAQASAASRYSESSEGVAMQRKHGTPDSPLYTRASLMPTPSSSSREIRATYKRSDYQGDRRAPRFE